MFYGYARVSTRGQVKGNSLAEQRQQLMDRGCDEVLEEQYTGTTTERPQLDALLTRLNIGDTLMVTKLDRLARSATEGATLIKELTDKGIRVNGFVSIFSIWERWMSGRKAGLCSTYYWPLPNLKEI